MPPRKRMKLSEVMDTIFNDSDSEDDSIVSENSAESHNSGPESDENEENVPHPSQVGNAENIQQNIRQPVNNQQNNNVAGQNIQNGHNIRQNIEYGWEYYEIEDPYSPDWFPDVQKQKTVLVDTDDYSALEFFKLYFPDEALQLVVDETNRYASQFLEAHEQLPPSSRFRKWEDTSVNEVSAMIAIQISMGLCSKPTLEEYWNSYWLLKTDLPSIMSRNRYQLLQTFLHFSNNTDRVERGNPGYNPLSKIQPLLDICEPRYEQFYQPGRELSIDESMIKFKGRIFFCQYMPAKPTKWGIKKFVLCESKTGYALRHMIYTGRESFARDPDIGLAEQVVLDLCRDYEHKNHAVYMDNYYSNPQLFKKLERNGIGACGTVNPLRKNMPENIKPRSLVLRKGDDPVFYRSENLVACGWHDTKRVTFLSTIDTNNTVDKQIRSRGADGGHRSVEKPVIAEHYNEHMAGVDLHDQMMGTYAYPHKCQKWYQPLFHDTVETALVNGYLIYKQKVAGGEKIMSPILFRKSVIDGLLEDFIRKSVQRCIAVPNEYIRLRERHFPKIYENKKYKPDCKVCASIVPRKRKQTSYYWGDCDTPLCVVPCFELFHTYKDFKRAREALNN